MSSRRRMTQPTRVRRRVGDRTHEARRWLVDGMNLIGSRPDGWWNDPDRAVRRLIDELDRYGRESREAVSVVFDRQPRDVAAGEHGAVAVAFASRRGRDAADDEIVEMVSAENSPATLTVVTSDGGLVERVRPFGVAVASSPSFRRRLDATLKGRTRRRSRP